MHYNIYIYTYTVYIVTFNPLKFVEIPMGCGTTLEGQITFLTEQIEKWLWVKTLVALAP